MTINVNDTFSTFAEFRERLKKFEVETFTQFTFRTSEKLPASYSISATLQYSVLRYVCKQGKAVHKLTDSKERCRQRSYKVSCPVQLNVRLNRPKGGVPLLKVTKLYMQHSGHEVSKEIFGLYPEQRRFTPDAVDTALLEASTMRTSEKRAFIERRHGKSVLMRDIYNKGVRAKQMGRGVSDGEVCDGILNRIVPKGGFGKVAKDDNGTYVFSAFQTRAMKDTLHRCPRVLVMDCTYRVNYYLYPLLTVMALDGDGHGMPISREDRNIMTQCLMLFAGQFDRSPCTCFVIDKDMAELAAIGEAFPGVPVNLCHFHISQAVERQLRKSLGRGPAAVKAILELFMAQVVTESETEFAQLTEDLKRVVSETVADYLQENWWSKRHLWAACCNVNVMKMHATTTNALESYHAKIKKTVSEKLSLGKTLESLVVFNDAKIAEAQRLRGIASVSHRYDSSDSTPLAKVITASMSRFGGELVKKELALSETIDYALSPSDGTDVFVVSYRGKSYTVTTVSCMCSSFGHMRLPCRHIFFLRRHLNVALFEDSLIPDHFKLDNVQGGTEHSLVESTHMSVSTATSSHRSMEGRYREAKIVADQLVDVLGICGEREFGEKLQKVRDMLGRWSLGEEGVDEGVIGQGGSGRPAGHVMSVGWGSVEDQGGSQVETVVQEGSGEETGVQGSSIGDTWVQGSSEGDTGVQGSSEGVQGDRAAEIGVQGDRAAGG